MPRFLPFQLQQVLALLLLLGKNLKQTLADSNDEFVLRTDFDGGIATRGCMFSVRTHHEIYITSFEINSNTGSHNLEIYTKRGSHVGFETDSLEFWNIVANVTIEGNGPFEPTTVALNSYQHIWIGENETQAFFFLMDTDNLLVTRPRSILADVGSLLASNPNLEIFRGIGVYEPFKYNLAYPIEWNGAIHYKIFLPNSIMEIESTLQLSCGDEVFGSTLNEKQISAPDCYLDNEGKSNFGDNSYGALKYSFVESKDTHVTISLCNEGTKFDSNVRIYRENKDGELECVIGNNNYCGDHSSFSFFHVHGDSVIILVDGNEGSGGYFEMKVICPKPLQSARTIGDLACGKSTVGTTFGLPAISAPSCEMGPVAHSIKDGKKGSVKYLFKEEKSKLVTMSLCRETDFDSQIRVYESGPTDELICVSANDDFCGLQSSLTFKAKANTDYSVVIDGHNGDEGTYSLDVTCPEPDIVGHLSQSFVMIESEFSKENEDQFVFAVNTLSARFIINDFNGEVSTTSNVITHKSEKMDREDEFSITVEYLLSFSSQSVDVTGFIESFVEHFNHEDNLRRFEDDLIFYGFLVIPGMSTTPRICDPINKCSQQALANSKFASKKHALVLLSGIVVFGVAISLCLFVQLRIWIKCSKSSDFSFGKVNNEIM